MYKKARVLLNTPDATKRAGITAYLLAEIRFSDIPEKEKKESREALYKAKMELVEEWGRFTAFWENQALLRIYVATDSSPESVWTHLESVAKEKNYSKTQLDHAKLCIENIYVFA